MKYIIIIAIIALSATSCTTTVLPDGTRITSTDPNAIRIIGEVLVEKAK